MANQEHVDLLKQGVSTWDAWRRKHPDICPDFRNVDLSRANLSGVNLGFTFLDRDNGTDFIKADLSGADLSRADLSHANLIDANLSGADLGNANLGGAKLTNADLTNANLISANLCIADLSIADLTHADLSHTSLVKAILYMTNLSGADLRGARLHKADLTNANLSGANLSNARLANTIFVLNDLSTAKGMTEVKHEGPSHIELHTIKLPQDGSAIHFLRGAGIPDEWIGDYRAHMMSPIQYHSCFISYSSADEVLAKRLHADLQDEGVRCWFAPHDLRPGQLIRKGIDEAIHLQDKLLLILSEASVESGWVGYEIETALGREIRQKREILFPIRIDEAVFHCSTSWSRELREKRHIGDFREWASPEHYQKVFQRLLRDLKAERGEHGWDPALA